MLKFNKYTRNSLHFFSNHFMKNFSTKTLELVLPNMNKLNVTIEDTKTLKDLEAEIKKNYNFEKIEFRTWDNSDISKNTEIDLIKFESDPIFMKINTSEWQLLNADRFDYTTTEAYKLKHDLKHDEKTDLNIISETIRNFNKNKNLKSNEIEEISFKLLKIKNSYFNKDLAPALHNFKNLEEIFSAYYKLRQEYAKLHKAKEKLMWVCETKAKLLILLGGLFFLIELLLIYYGTFVKYSWDIVEPMTYLMGCMNIVIILLYRKKFKHHSAFEYYSNKYFMRQVNKKKFDLINFEETGKKLKELEMILNK